MPLGATIWITTSLLERSLGYATTEELDRLSRTLEGTVRQFYQRERDALRREALDGRVAATSYSRGRHERLARGRSRVLGQRRTGAVQPVGTWRRSPGLHAQGSGWRRCLSPRPRRDPDAGAVRGVPADTRACRIDRVARSAARLHVDAAAACRARLAHLAGAAALHRASHQQSDSPAHRRPDRLRGGAVGSPARKGARR